MAATYSWPCASTESIWNPVRGLGILPITSPALAFAVSVNTLPAVS
jgi:hypothetical protein